MARLCRERNAGLWVSSLRGGIGVRERQQLVKRQSPDWDHRANALTSYTEAMNRILFPICVLGVSLFAGIVGLDGAPTQKKGTVCWPLHFAGITVGLTNDSQVQRLLGRGVFRPDEGHTGGRYFLDAKQTATLHIEGGVDSVVEVLTLHAGVDSAIKQSERTAAVSKWFGPQEGFGNWHALHLGSSKDEVAQNLGQPENRVNANKWVYETTCACELPEYLTISFKDGRVSQLELSAEE